MFYVNDTPTVLPNYCVWFINIVHVFGGAVPHICAGETGAKATVNLALILRLTFTTQRQKSKVRFITSRLNTVM